jgi:hypothetical protein
MGWYWLAAKMLVLMNFNSVNHLEEITLQRCDTPRQQDYITIMGLSSVTVEFWQEPASFCQAVQRPF